MKKIKQIPPLESSFQQAQTQKGLNDENTEEEVGKGEGAGQHGRFVVAIMFYLIPLFALSKVFMCQFTVFGSKELIWIPCG